MEPMEWLLLLNERLQRRWKRLEQFDNYFRGKHPLAFASDKFQEAFGGRLRPFADNWCPTVVEVVLERLTVRGFRWGDNVEADDQAWNIWQANQLDARIRIAMKEALVHGVAYTMIWPSREPGGMPRIWIEHPRQVIVAHNPGDSRDRQAALKVWSEGNRRYATLYLPDAIYKYRGWSASERIALPGGFNSPRGGWVPREVDDEPWPLPNALGVVPVVPLVNRPRLLDPDERDVFIGDGESDLAEVIPLQDAINKTLMDALVGSEYTAFPQRYIAGLEVERDPDTKAYMLPFKAGVDQVWWTKSTETNFGQFPAADLTGPVRLIELLIQHVASITRTPPHYFGQISGQFPSGESLKSAEAGLVARSVEKQLTFGEGFEETIALAFRARDPDDERGSRDDAETVWADPESRTEGEHVDALTKARQTLELPREMIWERYGLSPQERARARKLRAQEMSEDAALLFAAGNDVPLDLADVDLGQPQPVPVEEG